jgi:hypothetical protein
LPLYALDLWNVLQISNWDIRPFSQFFLSLGWPVGYRIGWEVLPPGVSDAFMQEVQMHQSFKLEEIYLPPIHFQVAQE